MKTSWHVATAAEAFAAAQFARCGWDVSVQYGANQPCYDLIAARDAHMMRVSVKGSKDGSWGLTQSFLTNGKADYRDAADRWSSKHPPQTVVCLVQFKGIPLDCLPLLYLATPVEIAEWLKAAAGGRGDTILYIQHKWTAQAKLCAGITDAIPQAWRFTEQRAQHLATAIKQTPQTLAL